MAMLYEVVPDVLAATGKARRPAGGVRLRKGSGFLRASLWRRMREGATRCDEMLPPGRVPLRRRR